VRDLSRGDRGKEVLDVQTRLRGQGFELGREGVDGFFGPHTEQAVLSFQQERGLLADGRVGANTWRELVEAGYALGDRLLYLRQPPFRGDDVLQLQVKLNLLGFNAGGERGVHDADVERAVLDFQQNAGLPADGIVGQSTLDKLEAVRKAESGREGKKIPERDRGWAAARTLTGQSVVIDPGHGGADLGCISPGGLTEKEVTLTLARRLAELLRADGCRVRLTREADERVPLYARCETADGAAHDFFLSLHCNHDTSPDARGGATYYFQRSHYYSEHGRRLAGYVGRRLESAGVPWLGRFGRNYGVLRETRAIALLVEPLFLTSPADERLARRPEQVEKLARALAGGLADYLARTPGPEEDEAA
jgi:N-acetylmuramoyl-L-alanine amidase